jgi:hypothetical protein
MISEKMPYKFLRQLVLRVVIKFLKTMWLEGEEPRWESTSVSLTTVIHPKHPPHRLQPSHSSTKRWFDRRHGERHKCPTEVAKGKNQALHTLQNILHMPTNNKGHSSSGNFRPKQLRTQDKCGTSHFYNVQTFNMPVTKSHNQNHPKCL